MQAPLWMGSSRIKQAQGWHELTIGDGTASLHIGEQKSRGCNWMVADAAVFSVHSLTPALMHCLHCCHDQSHTCLHLMSQHSSTDRAVHASGGQVIPMERKGGISAHEQMLLDAINNQRSLFAKGVANGTWFRAAVFSRSGTPGRLRSL